MKQPFYYALALTALFTGSALKVFAQDERDALRLSMLQPQGTARSMATGSALGSVGGDFTSLSVNPAGIGIYRRSEIMITPSLTFSNTGSEYSGNSIDESGSHFAISNVGIVTTATTSGRNKRSAGGWSSVSFGIGLTRLADFTRDYSYSGRNTTSSGSFVFESDANEFGLSNEYLNNFNPTSLGDLGYKTYLLDTFGTGYISVVNPTDTTPVSQSNIVSERGGISELTFTLGGAYQDKLLLGATLGVPIVRYTRSKTFEERDLSGKLNNDFEYFRYNDNLKTTGAGLNLKLGFIYKATDNFRFGAAIHTPTYYSLTDISNLSLTANTEGFGGTVSATAIENQYDYNISTPWRGVVSATGLFGPYGFFTVDYEYVDYASARIHFGQSQYEKNQQSYVNNLIKSTYQGASNIRTGLEFRFDNVSLRGGFGYYGNPYKSGTPSAERLSFSGGLGFRFANAFLDLAFVHNQWKNNEQPYQLPNKDPYIGLIVPTADLTTGSNTAVMTLGFKL